MERLSRRTKQYFTRENYPLPILRDYLRNRPLLYETLEGQKRMKTTWEIAKGPILGPDLWNATNDSLLKLGMPEEWRLVSYVDVVAELAAGCTVE